MSISVYASFIEVTRNIFVLMLDLNGDDIAEMPAEEFDAQGVFSVSIGIVGDLAGEVIYEFPPSTSLNVVGMMSGMEMDLVDDFVESAIAEIANIISGNVVGVFAREDIRLDILPPQIKALDKSTEYAVREDKRIITGAGDICLRIRLNPAE